MNDLNGPGREDALTMSKFHKLRGMKYLEEESDVDSLSMFDLLEHLGKP